MKPVHALKLKDLLKSYRDHVRSKEVLALLCNHVKSTLPCDVWMVLNVGTVLLRQL